MSLITSNINNKLPTDLLEYFQSFLTFDDKVKCESVCKMWQETAKSNVAWTFKKEGISFQFPKQVFILTFETELKNLKEIGRKIENIQGQQRGKINEINTTLQKTVNETGLQVLKLASISSVVTATGLLNLNGYLPGLIMAGIILKAGKELAFACFESGKIVALVKDLIISSNLQSEKQQLQNNRVEILKELNTPANPTDIRS